MSVATCLCGVVNQWNWTGSSRLFTCPNCHRQMGQNCDLTLQVLAETQWVAQVAIWTGTAVAIDPGPLDGPA